MHKVNLSGIDLNLLPPLRALLEARNVTLAARQCGLSQPAMSRALARLRALLGDALLVRVPHGYALTARAQSLRHELPPLLLSLSSLFEGERFDPQRARRNVRLMASDMQAVLLLPPLMAMLAAEAPGIRITLGGYRPDIDSLFLNRDIDFAFATRLAALGPDMRSMPIGDDRLALVMAKHHTFAEKPMSLSDYAAAGHATIAVFNDGRSDIDAMLADAGLTRRVVCTTPHFVAALAAVSRSELVTVVSRHLAEHFAPSMDLILREPPFQAADIAPTLIWHKLAEADPLLMWLRDRLVDIAKTVFSDAQAQSPPSPPSNPLS